MNARVSFQQEIRSYLLQKRIPNIDRTDGFDELDFEIIISGVNFHLEVKEKRQKYNLSNWDWEDREENLVIIDELSVRKCLRVAPHSGILIRDHTRDCYIFYSVLTLLLIPKKRVNRVIRRAVQGLKGKWLVDVRNGIVCTSLDESFTQIARYVETLPQALQALECLGNFFGESLGKGGIVRRPEHWEKDVRETR
ncbi:MAG: hypothetical protein QXS54_01310 [Candidatus Methanomethylicaceae archaeon]